MSDEMNRTTPTDEMDIRRRMMGFEEPEAEENTPAEESYNSSVEDDPFARMRATASMEYTYEEEPEEAEEESYESQVEDDPFARMRATASMEYTYEEEPEETEEESYEPQVEDDPFARMRAAASMEDTFEETVEDYEDDKEPATEPEVSEEPVNEPVAEAEVTEEPEEASTGSLYSRMRAAKENAPAPAPVPTPAPTPAPVKEEVSVEPAKEEPVKEDKKSKKAKKKAAKPAGPKVKGMRTYQQRQDRAGYAFMMPWIIGFVVFTLFPFIMTIYLSFTNVKSTIKGYEIDWVGLSNYQTAFFSNETFVPALLNYLKMIVPYTFIVVVLSFIIAYLLNKINTGKSILRTIYFLPVIIMSGPVMSQLLSVQDASAANAVTGEVINPYSNIFIMQIIDSYSPALANGLAAVFGQLSIILWFTGIPIVLFINGLQKINPSIYEAAKIDSANAWQIMWKITIPMVKETGLIITVFTVIQLGMYNAINPVYELIEEATSDTNGGLGFAATYSWIYSVVALLIIGIVFLLFRNKKPKDIKARQKQEKKLKKLDKQQQRRMAVQRRHQKKEARLYGK